jgi:hypothetical protein
MMLVFGLIANNVRKALAPIFRKEAPFTVTDPQLAPPSVIPPVVANF